MIIKMKGKEYLTALPEKGWGEEKVMLEIQVKHLFEICINK